MIIFNRPSVSDYRGEKGFSDNPLENLLKQTGTKTKGPTPLTVPSNWSLERITIRSAGKCNK
jgi:hypothetical protein